MQTHQHTTTGAPSALPPTTRIRLNNGVEVLAVTRGGYTSAKAYVNRTQAQRACAQLGSDWFVYKNPQFRPWHIARVNSRATAVFSPSPGGTNYAVLRPTNPPGLFVQFGYTRSLSCFGIDSDCRFRSLRTGNVFNRRGRLVGRGRSGE